MARLVPRHKGTYITNWFSLENKNKLQTYITQNTSKETLINRTSRLYVLTVSCKHFRVNLLSIVVWNSLPKTDAISEGVHIDAILKVFWKETIENTEKDLLEALCVGICERMFSIEKKFWDELYQLEKNTDNENLKDWLVKLLIHLERKMKKIIKIKRKKLQKLSGEHNIKELVSDRFTEHLGLFTFFDDFSKYCEAFSPDINNIANLVTLGNSFDNSKNDLNVSANSDRETQEETHNHPFLEKPSNVAT